MDYDWEKSDALLIRKLYIITEMQNERMIVLRS